jgi:Na+-transporting NADH:ubiquinone oxidoreductase subunit C
MKTQEKAWFPIVYMFIATLFFSAILIVFGAFTRQRVQDNERIAFERAVLEAVPIELPQRVSPAEIHRLYGESIRDATPQTGGALQYMKNDSLIAYALPLDGPGFWAPIKGVIGIAADKVTVTGIAFYEQNETPGLGGEITKPQFLSQFKGKLLAVGDVPLAMRSPTEPLDQSSVHAITGATQTSTRLADFMNEQLRAWRAAIKEE